MKFKLLLAFITINLFYLQNALSQDRIGRVELEEILLKTRLNMKSSRISYISTSRRIYVDYEVDSMSNRHLIYRCLTKKKYKEYAVIWKDKAQYSLQAGYEWQRRLPSSFQYNAWIDSCNSIQSFFDKPFKSYGLVREPVITGQPYTVMAVATGPDTFSLWINKTTRLIEKIVGGNKRKDIRYEWHFNLPFTVKAPVLSPISVDYDDPDAFYVFPPAFSSDEHLTGNEPVYTIPDKAASFPGGSRKFFEILPIALDPPPLTRSDASYGVMVLGFVIEKDGRITNYEVIRSVNEKYDQEIIHLISNLSGLWNPAEFRGEKVRSLGQVSLFIY